MKNFFFFQNIFLLIAMFCGAQSYAASIEQQRELFLKTEKLIQLERDEADLAENFRLLKTYPLYPYLKYHWLKRNLSRNSEIEFFLNQYKGSRYAYLLRDKWLKTLAKENNWKKFFRFYQNNGNAGLTCLFFWGKYQLGHKSEALTAAQKLWVVGRSQAQQCDGLFSKLMKSSYFTQKIIWQRFEAALNKGNPRLAKYVRKKMNAENKKMADFWLQVHNKPALVTEPDLWKKKYPQIAQIFAYGIYKYARVNTDKAIRIWDKRKNDFKIRTADKERVDKKLAMALAYHRNEQAYDRLKRLSKNDNTTRTWRVRAALQQNNWKWVNEALSALSAKEKQKSVWQYWQARAAEKLGDNTKAQNLYSSISEDRDFYGFMAADHVKKQYQLGDKPITLRKGQVEDLLKRPVFQMIKELSAVNKPLEARRHWWFTVKSLTHDEILVAAKLAQHWHWDQEAIFTIAKAGYWDDVSLRFPINYKDHVHASAKKNDLDPSIILGLIRRESAFNEKARSPVGARGLMQIMPKTGRQIAKGLKEKWRSVASLLNPEINVKYGSFYYKKLLDKFNGHFALAAAAYNAGPHRVLRWLPKSQPVPADIWIETIPFTETRKYVAAVLAYALIYQKQMQRNTLKIKDFTRDVLPR